MAVGRNILLFHQGALGDFIVTWPLALGLARVFAQSRTFYITAAQKGLLAEKVLRIESSDVENGWHHLFSENPRLPDSALKLLVGAQLIVSFVSGSADLWAKNVRRLSPDAPLITLGTVPPENFAGHITGWLLDQLKPWPVAEAAMGQMLSSLHSRGLGLPAAAAGKVVIHPGAGSAGKCWPAENFLDLARRLSASGRNVQILIGEVERERWPRTQIESFAQAAELCQPQTLVHLLNVLSGGSIFVGNDSGPGHLAGILGIPTICIFGPRDCSRWKPLGPSVHTLEGQWLDLSVERILAALDSL